jgi:hypothetical protein
VSATYALVRTTDDTIVFTIDGKTIRPGKKILCESKDFVPKEIAITNAV